MSRVRSCLYVGRIMHHRRLPFAHRFVYRVFSLYLDLDELPTLDGRSKLFSVERPNLLAFYNRDHGPRDGSPLAPWVLARLAERGIVPSRPRIMLLCFPRLFGYVFNPLSIYFCYDGERLAGVVYEVKNTFGEQTAYVLPAAPAGEARLPLAHGCAKSLYVSPFIGMRAWYGFRFRVPDDRLAFVIRETVPEGVLLVASHTGERRPLDDREILRCVLTNPLMTFKVILGIHWEAARLWLKGARYFPRKVAPTGQHSAS